MQRIESVNKFHNGPEPLKKERICIRVDPKNKKLLEKAASYANETISSFVRHAAIETARDIAGERAPLILSERDGNAFFDALENPPGPNKGLLKAASRYRRLTGL